MAGRGRSCGSCSLCCTLQGVREGLDAPKPPGVPCAKLDACGGCTIYNRRPMECMYYTCMWLDGFGLSSDRPDKLGVVFELQGLGVAVRPRRAGLERKPRVRKLMRQLVRRGLPVGIIQIEDNPENWAEEPVQVEVITDPDKLP